MGANGEREEALHAAISGLARDGDIVTGWLLVTTTMDADGVDRVEVNSAPGNTLSTDLGLANYADRYLTSIIESRLRE